MTLTKVRAVTDADRLATARAEIDRLRAELRDAVDAKNVAEATLAGDIPRALWWLQSKADRQRVALDRHTVRATSHRLALRTLDRLGRGLTRDEWRATREAEAHLRTEEAPPVA